MSRTYSQSRALWAITRASFKAIFSQPMSVIFSLLFPIIFILIFGAFGNGGPGRQSLAIAPGSDTTNALFDSIRKSPLLRIVEYPDTAKMNEAVEKGKLTAILDIRKQSPADSTSPHYRVFVHSSSASGSNLYVLLEVIDHLRLKTELARVNNLERTYAVQQPILTEGKRYRQIDFVLPGQLGFSILFSTLFGVAVVFFSLREQLVLKRFYASPVKRINILLGIGMSRLFFQLINVVVLILFGHFFLNFTLVNGALTFIEMVVLSVYMLFLLMGVGLIIASVAKNDTTIPLMINLFGFPQMLLSGTFFPIEVFPKWLQDLCQILPLTQFNTAMRKISFEGLHLIDCWKEIGIMGIWLVVAYAIASKIMKWE
ncbi:ABC transporter permease [Nostoc ellipsosporum NOK]|nr:ABC transporter permease [Nostoc ellipsosporum NOK]